MADQPIAGLWEALRTSGLSHLAVAFVNNGVRSVDDVTRRISDLRTAGISQADLESFLASLSKDNHPEIHRGRADHPVCHASNQRASFTLALQAAAPNNRKRALDNLQADILAKSSAPAQESRLKTYRALCSAWDVPAFPLSLESVRCVAASLKAGFYRSPQLYFQAASGYQMRSLGLPVDSLVRGTIKEVVRSVKRGLGPAKLKDSFDVWKLHFATVSDDEDSFDFSSVEHCTDMVIIGSWWMLRELEMSSAKVQHLYVEEGLAHLLLPVHKTETAGSLSVRSLGCACKGHPARLCPWHAVERHLVRVYGHKAYRAQQHFPLFPTADGLAPSKQCMIQAIESVLQSAGIELTRVDESGNLKRRFGGHTLRVSGAQFLASAGTPTPLIQLLGRWSSMAVERYIQMAPLSIVPEVPAQVLSNFECPGEDATRLAWHATHSRPSTAQAATPFLGVSANADVQAAQAPLTALELDPSALTRVSALEAAVIALQSAMVPPERTLVVRARSRKVHLAQLDELQNPPAFWRAKCGWAYGNSDFYRVQQLSIEHSKCRKCFSDDPGTTADDDESASNSSGVSTSEDSSDEEPS